MSTTSNGTGTYRIPSRRGIERLRARMTTAMMSLETRRAVPLPEALREGIESYRQRATDAPSASAE
jgi:acyl-CoA thioesterase FadM